MDGNAYVCVFPITPSYPLPLGNNCEQVPGGVQSATLLIPNVSTNRKSQINTQSCARPTKSYLLGINFEVSGLHSRSNEVALKKIHLVMQIMPEFFGSSILTTQ